MPKRVEGKTSIRFDLEGEELERFEILKRHYSISSNKDLVSFLLKREYDQISQKRGEEAFKGFIEFFNRRPDLLKKLGYNSAGQLLEETIREDATPAERVVRSG